MLLQAAPGAEPSWPAAIARREEHVWIRVEALRELAAAAGVEPGWQAGFDGMIAFARTRGWVDEELEAVRAHVERRAEPAEAPPG